MNTQSRIQRWSVIIGIIIVLNLFFNYALSLVYKQPDYIAYCPTSQIITAPQTQNQCLSQGGQWTENGAYGPKAAPVGVSQPSGYCDLQYTCRNSFDAANKIYDRNVFVTLVILGALAVFLGNFFKANDVIASGLALAGVLSFVIASFRYWGAANDLVRVFILLVALAILFWIALKKFRNVGIQP